MGDLNKNNKFKKYKYIYEDLQLKHILIALLCCLVYINSSLLQVVAVFCMFFFKFWGGRDSIRKL
jgi:hypothetical protein